ncbi:phenylalanine--tRNA ligase subunit beta [Paenibacillus sp. Z6-24]
MKVSTQWLSQYVSLEGVHAEDLAEQITRAGIEIDSVEQRNQGITGVVVGYVKSKEKHPDADKLNVCIVDAGQEEDLQIVCGAKNVDAGQKVPVALIGAKLPGDFHIKKAKLRGVLSQGMICSAKELGINDKLLPKEQQEGILVLPEQAEIGTPVVELLGLNDEVLDFDLTPNRSDCLSMIGAAYEVGAILGREVKLPEVNNVEGGDAASGHISVSIEAQQGCSHFSARYISGIQVAPSPLWMQNRLIAAGVRPINNVVDITNFVMLEYGQPLHAYDADTLSGGAIEVRMGREGEVLKTLDDQERKLDERMLVIASGGKAVGLAGVMGGADTEVTPGTVNILLESARFDGGTVRKTSRRLGLRSEASLRFEKEVDPAAVVPALNRAAELIARYAHGMIHEGVVEQVVKQPEEKTLILSLSKVNRYLGTELSMLEVKTIFGRLHFACGDYAQDQLEIRIPTRRGDIERDVDLIEEVARLYGYDNIPTTAIEGATTPGALTHPQRLRRTIRRLLVHGGYNEVISYSFTHPDKNKLFPQLRGSNHDVALAMPMSEERSVLRTGLVSNMLEIASYNRNRKQENLALFELGMAFFSDEEKLTRQPQEVPLLGLLLTGRRQQAQWNTANDRVDFFDIKGALDGLFGYLGLQASVSYRADQPEGYHPGRSASVYLHTGTQELRIGTIGQIHPDIQREADLEDTYVAEIELATLYDQVSEQITYSELPRYPSVQRDIAVVVNDEVPAGDLLNTIRETAGELLESVQVFDVFKGERLGEGKKSVAIALVYRHQEHTLTDEEVTGVHEQVIARLAEKFEAELRK